MMCWGKSKSGWPRQGHQIPGHERLLAMKPKKLGRHETDKAPVPPLQDMTRTRFNRAADFHGLACRCQRGWCHWREVRQFAEPAAIMAPAESGNDISPACSNLPWPDRRNDMDSASQGGSKLYERAIN